MLVLDANILLRAVLGSRVSRLLKNYPVNYFAPDAAFAEARRVIPTVLTQRGEPVERALANLDSLRFLVEQVPRSKYARFGAEAKARMKNRDVSDWPTLACALALDAPIWTEDRDYFGVGVATWASDTVEMYLKRMV